MIMATNSYFRIQSSFSGQQAKLDRLLKDLELRRRRTLQKLHEKTLEVKEELDELEMEMQSNNILPKKLKRIERSQEEKFKLRRGKSQTSDIEPTLFKLGTISDILPASRKYQINQSSFEEMKRRHTKSAPANNISWRYGIKYFVHRDSAEVSRYLPMWSLDET